MCVELVYLLFHRCITRCDETCVSDPRLQNTRVAKNDTEWHQNDYADYRAHQFESATPTVPRPSATDRLDPTKLACGAPGLVASLFYSRGQTHAAYLPQYGQDLPRSSGSSAARAAAVGIGAELLVAGADAAVAVLAVLVAGAGADAAAGIGADAAVAVIAEVIAAMIAELLVAGADAGAAARFGAAFATGAPPDLLESRSHQRQ